ncbi:hybrid sensor histidine kinase/response regulator [Methylomonas sp. AM2-LC]|uniref:hybrid sensor histidine kinase/response regulator n=1 Tax=Methylomonas sp. AM2-LC TaxID=3153301 RepID=UPI003267F15E
MKPRITEYKVSPTALVAERIKILYAHAPQVLFGGMLAAVILALILYSQAETWHLSVWLICLMIVNSVRYALMRRYQCLVDQHSRPLFWGWLFALGCCFSGLLWGAGFYLFFQPEAQVLILLTLVLAGMIAGSVASLSAFKPAYYGYVLLAALPFIARLALEGQALYWQVAGLTVLFTLINLLYAENAQNVLISAIKLRFEKETLADELHLQIQATDIAKQAAEQANLEKSWLLAATSHDLRQPVHAQGLYLDILHMDLVGRPEQELVLRAIEAGAAINDMLDALTEMARIDAGSISPQISRFSLDALLERLHREFLPQANLKGLTLRLACRPCWCGSDPILLERLLRNLIANAIRYTEAGGVLITLRGRQSNWIVQIWDTGIGIPDNQINQIFVAFKQLVNPERDRKKGLGLGLAIVQRIADLLDHELTVKSRFEYGSVFEISVPKLEPPENGTFAQTLAGPDLLPQLKILVVDDDAMVLHAIRTVLLRFGCHCVAAANAETALAAADDHHDLDIILTDFRLQGSLNGAELVSHLHDKLGRLVPAAIVTGDISREQIATALASGLPVLHKPLDAAQLRALLSALPHQARL